jgi:oligoendopeptidase F
MTSRSTSVVRKPNSAKSAAKTKMAAKTTSKAGKLPEWNLADLYAGIDAPEIANDLAKMDSECVAFETDYKGKLAEHTAREDGGKWLAEAVRRYEGMILPAASAPMPVSFTRATMSMPRSRNSMATSPSG